MTLTSELIRPRGAANSHTPWVPATSPRLGSPTTGWRTGDLGVAGSDFCPLNEIWNFQ